MKLSDKQEAALRRLGSSPIHWETGRGRRCALVGTSIRTTTIMSLVARGLARILVVGMLGADEPHEGSFVVTEAGRAYLASLEDTP